MPELPEVETVRRGLENLLLGFHCGEYQLFFNDYLRIGHNLIPSVNGGKVIHVKRRGKILAIQLSNNLSLLHHLGMSGRIICCPAKEPVAKHTHLIIHFENKEIQLRQFDPRRFGYCGICNTDQLNDFAPWSQMGPDPFQLKSIDLKHIFDGRKRAVKAVLLEQHLIGGMGNIYVDESLFRAKIHPLRSAQNISLEECKTLLKYMKIVLKESIAAGGSSTNDFQKMDGTLGEFQHKHRVYRREGKKCLKCNSTIEKITLAGRGTHFCPNCQN